MKAEKPPASPQCTDCPLWKYGAVSCARFNLRYALNEMLKELPFFCRTAEEKIVCPHKEAKNNMAINVSDLPPKYQAQAMKKYMEQQQRRGQHLPPRRRRIQQRVRNTTTPPPSG